MTCAECAAGTMLSPETGYTMHVKYLWDEAAFQREGQGRGPVHYWKQKDFIPCGAPREEPA